MRIIIEQIDDAYFHLADKTESFGCKYHLATLEFILIKLDEDGSAHLFNPENNVIQHIDKETFESDFNMLGHPIFLGQLIDIMDKRVNNMYTAVTDEAFARYVYLAKFIVDAWTVKGNPLEGACISEDLFNNLIKLLGDFFDDPKPSEYKASQDAQKTMGQVDKEEEIAMEAEKTKDILSSKKSKGQTGTKQKKN